MSVVDRFARARQIIRCLTLYNFYKKYTKAYIGFVALFALTGYLYLLLFPAGVVFGTYQLFLTVQLPVDNHMITLSVIWSCIILFCAGITHSLITLKFKEIEGIPLTPDKAQLIFNKVEEIQQNIKWPKIDKIILSRRYELNIIKTPKRFAPFWSTTTLVIGYPFLQTQSAEFFDCALTRKLLQFAKRRNVFINWLNFLRNTWEQYPGALKERHQIGDQLSYGFFRAYSWLYRHAALYATQLDELQADSLALNELNDRDLFRAVESVKLMQKFLNDHYWPKLSSALRQVSASPEKIKPYEHLPRTSAQLLNSGKAEQWLKMFMLETDSEGSHEPSFQERMDMMGYRKICPLQPFTKTAAEYYFGPVNPKLVAHMNKLWAHHVKQEMANKKQKKRAHKSDPTQQKLLVAF